MTGGGKAKDHGERGPLASWLARGSLHGASALGAFALVAALAGPASAKLQVEAKPALSPSFKGGNGTYVTRCTDKPVRLTATARGGSSLSVDGGPYRRGRFHKRVELTAGEAFHMRARRPAGAKRYTVRCLPEDFPQWRYHRMARPDSKFLLTAFGRYPMIFNRHGTPVWWYQTDNGAIDAHLLPNGLLAWGLNDDPNPSYVVRNAKGKLKRRLRTVGIGTNLHDIQLLHNGDYLLIGDSQRDGVDLTAYGGPANGSVLDAVLQEVDPKGNVVWTWNSKDHISLAETGRFWNDLEPPVYDIVHINSAEIKHGRVLISMRHTDAVYSVDKATGDVVWKLGGTHTPQSLAVRGDPHGDYPFGGQHDARNLGGGVISAFDDAHELDRPPRGVRYKINEAAGTARLIYSVSDPHVDSTFCCGSNREVGDGGSVVTWGGTPKATGFAPDGSIRFRFGVKSDRPPLYRVVPVPDGALKGRKLQRGMNARYPRPAGG